MVTFVPAVDLQAIEIDEEQQHESKEEDQGPVKRCDGRVAFLEHREDWVVPVENSPGRAAEIVGR